MSTIRVIALRPFIYSTNGYTEIPVKEKQIFDLPEHMFKGLNDARYVRREPIGDGHVSLRPSPSKEDVEAKIAPIVDTAVKLQAALTTIKETGRLPVQSENEKIVDGSDVEIPDDWKTLKFFALRSLASKFSSTPIKSTEDAVAAIEAELARRG